MCAARRMRTKVQIHAPDASQAPPRSTCASARKPSILSGVIEGITSKHGMGGNDMWERQLLVIACLVSLFLKNGSTPRTQDLCLSHL